MPNNPDAFSRDFPRAWLRALVLLGLGLLSVVQAIAQCVKTVRWYDDAPYSFKTADGEVAGLNPDLVRAALKGLNCDARFVELPWARCASWNLGAWTYCQAPFARPSGRNSPSSPAR